MFSKTKIVLVAVAFLGSGSAALAQSGGEGFRQHPNAPLSFRQPRAQLFEGRNVAVRIPRLLRNESAGTGTYETIPSFGGY